MGDSNEGADDDSKCELTRTGEEQGPTRTFAGAASSFFFVLSSASLLMISATIITIMGRTMLIVVARAAAAAVAMTVVGVEVLSAAWRNLSQTLRASLHTSESVLVAKPQILICNTKPLQPSKKQGLSCSSAAANSSVRCPEHSG